MAQKLTQIYLVHRPSNTKIEIMQFVDGQLDDIRKYIDTNLQNAIDYAVSQSATIDQTDWTIEKTTSNLHNPSFWY